MSSDELDRCPVCSSTANDGFRVKTFQTPDILNNIYRCDCPVCGGFQISQRVIGEPIETQLKGKTHLLSGVLRDHSQKGIKEKILDIEDAKDLIQSAPPSETFLQKMDLLLLYIASKSEDCASLVPLNDHDYPLIYLRRPAELRVLLETLYKMGYLDKWETAGNHLSFKGWEKVDQLHHSMPLSDQAFVAMWFDPETDSAFKEGFQPGIEDTGYKARRIDMKEYNNKICEEIIAEIRRSAFVVADFTGNRQGVYFEAGFALGLGIPVIWTCHKDHIKELHFDTRQYNHIVWESPEELRKKLKTRIEATMPIRPVQRVP